MHVNQARQPSGAALPVAAKLVVGEIPGQPPGFVDRPELTDLTRLLAESGRAAVCAGGRGVGKSALAAAYARAAIADPHGPQVVVWVSGASEAALTAGLTALARRANLHDDGEDADQSAARARDYLSGLAAPALLVIDNAEEPARTARWLPTGRCQVLLTSTDQAFTTLAAPVPVRTYTRPQSLAYLADRTGLQDSAGAGDVAQALGDLPLALAQAASVVAAQGLTYARYLDKLSSAQLAATLPAIPGYPHALAQAIQLSVQAVTSRHRLAQDTLDLLSVLDPNGVTRTLLTQMLRARSADATADSRPNLDGGSDDDVDEVIAILTGASLVTLTADRTGLTMHRLIGRTLRAARADSLSHLIDDAGQRLDETIPGPTAAPPALSQVTDLTAQTLTLLDHTNHHELPAATVHAICSTATTVGIWLYAVGAYTEMLTIDEQTLAVRERVLGPEHPDTLTSRNNLAIDYQAVGRSVDAVALFEQTLAVRERVLGPEHPDTLTSRHNLAAGYQGVDRSVDAVALDEQTLAVRERVLGPEHPDTLKSRNNLAAGYQAVDRYEDAVALDEQTLAVRERVLGPEHPDSLKSRNNLAAGYQAVGRSVDAVALDEQTLAVMERVLGPEHPHTLTSRNNLAAGYREVGRSVDAVALDEQTLAVRERVLGPEHPDTLTSRHGLAIGYRAVGRSADAVALDEQTLAVRERVLGPEHPHTLASRHGLANGYQEVGRHVDAVALLEQTLAVRERVLGPEHPHTLTTRNNLAAGYRAVGRYEDARQLESPSQAASGRAEQ